MTNRSATLFLILLLSGCDASSTATPDAAVAIDGDRSETCEAIAASITCSDADRECGHRALGAHCGSERSDVLAEDLACIREHSTDSCRSFPDPSGANACIEAVHARFGFEAAIPLADLFAARCAGDFPASRDAAIHRMVPPLATLSTASLEALTPCVEAATSCAAARACFEARYPDVYACYE